jgi:cytochrome c551/c552
MGCVWVRLLVLMGVSLLGVILASTASLVVLGQPSEAEAKSAFEGLGCIACHRSGGIGNSWDEIVSRYKALAGKHASLDEFVEAEVSQEVKSMLGVEVRSWSELFKTMAQYAGKRPDDPGVKTVESFLASLLGVQTPGATTPPTTPTTPTQVTTPPATTPVEERGVSFLVAALAALIIVAAIVLAAFWLARR